MAAGLAALVRSGAKLRASKFTSGHTDPGSPMPPPVVLLTLQVGGMDSAYNLAYDQVDTGGSFAARMQQLGKNHPTVV